MLNENTGVYTGVNGTEYKSIGCVNYGNNNFYEVMVTETFKKELKTRTHIDSDQILFFSHDEGYESNGENIGEFFSHLDAHHLIDVVEQLNDLFK